MPPSIVPLLVLAVALWPGIAPTTAAADSRWAEVRATEVSGASATASAPGLVAAYAMDENAGPTVQDSSGAGNHGAITDATWARTGRFGAALSFNGSSSLVSVADAASLDLTTGMTVEGWVNPAALGNAWRTVVLKEQPGGMVYSLYANGTSKHKVPSAHVHVGGDRSVFAPSGIGLSRWTHLATTYDGSALRLYVDGALVAQRAQTGSITTSTGALRIGGNLVSGRYFGGLIDEVRVYNRALTASEIQSDMGSPVGNPDMVAPSAPTNLTATGSLTSAALSWTAATDDVGVARYNVHRSTSGGFTPSPSNLVGTSTGASYTDAGLSAGTYHYKVTAEDAAGNVGPPSDEASARVGDTTAPSAPGTLSATGGADSAALNWGAASDDVGVARYNVHRSTSDGFTPSSANRVAQTTETSYADGGLSAGTYHYRVTAEDAAGNVGPPSDQASAVVAGDTQAPSAPSNLSASVSGTSVSLGWTTSSDNVGVVGYDVHRSTTAGFSPTSSNRIAQTTGTSHTDSGLAAGTYHYKVRARDAAGNLSSPSGEASATVAAPTPGLVAAYGFSEGSGTTTADASGNGNAGSLSGTSWAASGRYDTALSFNGSSSRVTVPDSPSLRLGTGMTLEAWVRPSALGGWRTVIFKERTGWYSEVLYANTDTNRPSTAVFTSADHDLRGTAQLPSGSWTHLAATYDGATLRLYVNGAQVASRSASGSIANDSGALRIGGNAVWGEYFDGLIDEVRIYNRALGAAEIEDDMARSVTTDTTAPSVVARTPGDGATGVGAETVITATFSEPMEGSSITTSTFVLRDPSGTAVPATVAYDAATEVATLRPQEALRYGTTYRATVKGGAGGVTDTAGNVMAADDSRSFTTEAAPPRILLVGSAANPFASYLAEILRAEGLNAFRTIDVGSLGSAIPAGVDVVVLGDVALTSSQVSVLSSWVTGGGNLVASRPDKQLASLLGLSDAGGTLNDGYLEVDTRTAAGAGITGTSMQYHGAADRYALNGASAVATLYSTATTSTSNPAVTLRPVGIAGGEAAAFTFDVARSVVLTRQGNPAWVGQERDGITGVRPNDLFYGAKSGDVQPDWVDTSRIAIPQADEQQRLLANLITLMERDNLPLPRFWYLPRGNKAAVVLSGDDHSPGHSAGYTAANFDHLKSLDPAGCAVGNWECVRSTAFVYPSATLTDAQAASYLSSGFEVAMHPSLGSCPTVPATQSEINAAFTDQLRQFTTSYPSVPSPASNRIHCVAWPDWSSVPRVERSHGMRMDGNYYHYPGSWIGSKPGFLNGGGFPMRFAELDGTAIDVYQQNTNMNDEADQTYPSTVDALLDNAVGSNGFFGTFGVNIHFDWPAPQAALESIVRSAQARGVPLISYKQLLEWTDGRNASTIHSLEWSGGTLTFGTSVAAGAAGLQTMVPTRGPTGVLSGMSCGGSAVPYTLRTVKGVEYAMFSTVTGTCRATYA